MLALCISRNVPDRPAGGVRRFGMNGKTRYLFRRIRVYHRCNIAWCPFVIVNKLGLSPYELISLSPFRFVFLWEIIYGCVTNRTRGRLSILRGWRDHIIWRKSSFPGRAVSILCMPMQCTAAALQEEKRVSKFLVILFICPENKDNQFSFRRMKIQEFSHILTEYELT